MAYGAIRKRLNLIFLNEPPPRGYLIGGMFPIGVKGLVPWPDETLRVPVTIQTPFHVEGLFFPHQGHPPHTPVTRAATDPFVDVNTVIEIDKIGEVVNPCPFERDVGPEARANGLQDRAVGPDLRMAGHACFGRGDSREGRLFDRGMTVATVNPEPANVVFVTKRDGLRLNHTRLRHVGRAVERQEEPNHGCEDEYGAEDADL